MTTTLTDLDLARLAADRLLDTEAVAARAGVAVSTISTYLARGYLPQPAARITGRPVWTVGQIDEWLANRPGRGVGGGPKRGRGKGHLGARRGSQG